MACSIPCKATLASKGLSGPPWGAYTGRFFGRESRASKHEQDMLCSPISILRGIGGTYDLLRTSIAVDRERVKTVAAFESSPSQRVGLMESGDGAGTQLWIESGERVAGVAAGSIGRDAAAALAGMVLSRPRQSGQEASHVGGGSLFCSIAALGVGLVARRAPGTGPGPGCDDVGTTLHGAVYQRVGARLRHPGGLEGLGLQSKRELATLLANAARSPGGSDPRRMDGAGVG